MNKFQCSIVLLIVSMLNLCNCCKVTTIKSDCIYGQSVQKKLSSLCDSITEADYDTINILIDHDDWKHFYRAKDTVPNVYYEQKPTDRNFWGNKNFFTIALSNTSGRTQIDSIVFCDSTIVKIRKIDYSQKTMEGVKIIIEKKNYGDVPVFIWAKNTSFSSLLRVTDSSLVLEPLCKHETFRETSISPFWVSVGEQLLIIGLPLAVIIPISSWISQK